MSRRLVLFDIDGTLLSTGGADTRVFGGALHDAFGTVGDTVGFEYSGKTDPQIARELMEEVGFSRDEIEKRRKQALEQYQERLATSLKPTDVLAKPGVTALLEALDAEPHVALGLLTGNLEANARLKLEPLDANRFFAFGAFGSDHEDRYRLPAIALERARATLGIPFEGPDVVIVGDSVHDVLCGRELGVRAVAVATGKTSRERLTAACPDALLSDFSDTRASVAAIVGDGHRPS